jgi:2-polyprenyl-3-methyl-5-hydroxy-6-metoxy-1,4-benzoquinol methylase
VESTSDPEYAKRLARLQGARWKLLLDVQRPYRWNIRRHCQGRVLDVGCGTGRNLVNLRGAGIGVDVNEDAVRYARSKGLAAYTPDEFLESGLAVPGTFDSMLVAHVLEHVDVDSGNALLAAYADYVRPGGTVLLICPQERGFASDSSHVRWVDFAELRRHAAALDLDVLRQYSFPVPRALGRAFIYNEFVLVARTPK